MAAELFRLDGKVAVVIGGAGGLGEPIALGFAQQGAKVVVASRRLEAVQEVAEKIRKETGADAAAFQVDATNEQSVAQLVEQVEAKFGTVDILMNAHGTTIKRPVTEFPLDDWNLQFDLNVNALAYGKRNFTITVSSLQNSMQQAFPAELGIAPTLRGKYLASLFGFPFFSPSLLPYYLVNGFLSLLS